MEFETELGSNFVPNVNILEFTPLEFETPCKCGKGYLQRRLEFTPLEFETLRPYRYNKEGYILEFTPLEFETKSFFGYS